MATTPVPFPTLTTVFFPTTAPEFGFFPVSSYGAPPAFPCAATYPYPPPASACTGTAATGFPPTPAFPYAAPFPDPPAPPGFFQAPAYCPSTFPSTATFYPPEFGSFLSESSCLTQEVNPIPTLAHTPIHGDPIPTSKMSNAGVPAGRTMMELHENEVPRMVENKASDEKFICKQMGSNALSMANANLNHRSSMEGDAAVQEVADERVPAKDAILHRLQCELLNIQARLCQQQAHEQTSFDTLQGELAKLKSRVSQYTGKQSTSADTSKLEQSQQISIVPAAPTHVGPQVFAEMSTPITCQVTHRNSNLSEQDLDGMPRAYGLHNLNCRSVFLADGTEHSYYALPDTYPLRQATPSMSPPVVETGCVTTPPSVAAQVVHRATACCSKTTNTACFEIMLVHCLQEPMIVQDYHNVAVELHVSAEENQESEQLDQSFAMASENASSEKLKDFRKAPETEHTSACPYITSDVQNFTIELQQQDDERFEINSKKQEVLINRQAIAERSGRGTTRCSASFLKFGLREKYPVWPCIWDPGIDGFSYKKRHCFRWVPRSAIFILQQLPNKTISSLLEFSFEKGRQVQWDPGIKLLLYELLWLKTVRERTEYAWRHLLAMEFGTQDSTYFIDTAATMCPRAILIQQERNFAAVLYFCLSIFNDIHCCRIFQKCNEVSSQLYWHQDVKLNGIALWLITFNPP